MDAAISNGLIALAQSLDARYKRQAAAASATQAAIEEVRRAISDIDSRQRDILESENPAPNAKAGEAPRGRRAQ